MQEGRSDAAMVEAGWSGVMSLPRFATLGNDGTLEFAPVPEIGKLRRNHSHVPAQVLVAGTAMDTGVSGNQLDLEVELQLSAGAELRLGLLGSVDGAEETVVILGRSADGGATGMLHLDRTRSSLDLAVDVEEKSGPLPMTDGWVRLRILVDRSAVEIFANGKPLTARVYPTQGGGRVTLAATEGTVRLLSFDAWTMAGVFEETRSLLPERK
jgi:beta-fructofuranosidase